MAEAAKRRRGGAAPTEPPPHAEDGQVCTVSFCPICLAVTAVQPLKPEAVEHLLNAGREFLLAMTSILATRTGGTEREERRSTLTRIDIE
jgi:hypothetical protein